MKYWAFLSYSHTDKGWGDWLHKELETYRVPRRLVGIESRDGKIPDRLFPIFRDREELPVSADLGTNITQALRESRYLIVICSPRSVQSRWVGEEIKTFKRLGHEDRVLALIVDGEPNATDGKPGSKIEDECFHEAMRYRMVDGELSTIPTEPIAADARAGKDGRANAKLKLLAGLLGVNYDDLKQREHERRLKRARAIVAASAILIGVFAALSVTLFFKEREATRAMDEARANLGQSYFLQALRSIGENKDLDALAQLSRSISLNQNNQAAVCRLITLLTYRNFPVPFQDFEESQSTSTATSWNAKPAPPLPGPWTQYPDEVPILSGDRKRLLTVFTGIHSADAASTSGHAHVWDLQSGRLIAGPIDFGEDILSAQFNRDASRLLTVSFLGFRIWDSTTGKPVTEPALQDGKDEFLDEGRFSDDGASVRTTSNRHTTKVWSVASRALPVVITHQGLTEATFSTDGNFVVTCSTDKTARIWDAATGKVVGKPMTHDYGVTLARYSPNGKHIVTACGESSWDTNQPGIAQLWDTVTQRPLGKAMRHDYPIDLLQFSPDGKYLATVSQNSARIWDAENGESLIPSLKHAREDILSIAFSRDSKRVVTIAQSEAEPTDKAIEVWDIQTGRFVVEWPVEIHAVRSLEFSPDDPNRILVGHGIGLARVWDISTGKAVTLEMAHEKFLTSAGFSGDGKKIVTAAASNTVRVWDGQTGKPLIDPLRLEDGVSSADFDPNGQRIVTASGKTVRVWDAMTGKPVCDPIENNSSEDWSQESAKFTPNGERIMATCKDTVRIWDLLPAGNRLPSWLGHLADTMARQHLNNQGISEELDRTPAESLKHLKNQLNAESSPSDWTIWGRWFLADRSTRTISPFSKITAPEYIENLIRENTLESLNEAGQLAVGNPELVKRIRLAKESLSSSERKDKQE